MRKGPHSMITEKHEVLLRLKTIELLAYWEDRLVTNKLIDWFGISRQQASADIKRYLTNHNPNSLVHDPSVKAYVTKPDFHPVLTKGHINEYLDMISALDKDSASITLEVGKNMDSVQLPDRAVKPEVVREVIKACRVASSIKIMYASMSNPKWSERIISPHTVVYTGFRWHVRAYCHKHQMYRDFVLSRINATPKLVNIILPNTLVDNEWNETIALTIIPNTKLSDGQKELVEKDFGMLNGKLQLSAKKALAHYTLQRYQVAISLDEANHELKFPIQLQESDRKKLTPFLFNSDS